MCSDQHRARFTPGGHVLGAACVSLTKKQRGGCASSCRGAVCASEDVGCSPLLKQADETKPNLIPVSAVEIKMHSFVQMFSWFITPNASKVNRLGFCSDIRKAQQLLLI